MRADSLRDSLRDRLAARRPTLKVRFSLGLEPEDEAMRLGAWLVRRRRIDRYQLFSALNHAFHGACRLGDALVELGFLPREDVEREASAHGNFLSTADTSPLKAIT